MSSFRNKRQADIQRPSSRNRRRRGYEDTNNCVKGAVLDGQKPSIENTPSEYIYMALSDVGTKLIREGQFSSLCTGMGTTGI